MVRVLRKGAAMSLSPDEDVPAIVSAVPQHAEKRDLLGNFCFYLHFAVMLFVVAGWALPFQGALLFYLVFVPAMAAHWFLNKNTCILNNTESWLRYGTWRSEQNTEEGAWLKTLIKNVTGLDLKVWHVDLLTYGVLLVLWAVAFSHYRGW